MFYLISKYVTKQDDKKWLKIKDTQFCVKTLKMKGKKDKYF